MTDLCFYLSKRHFFANDKEEAVLTNERILDITGTKRACCDCVGMVVSKLFEGGPEMYMYD
jgi:hypothetical protein